MRIETLGYLLCNGLFAELCRLGCLRAKGGCGCYNFRRVYCIFIIIWEFLWYALIASASKCEVCAIGCELLLLFYSFLPFNCLILLLNLRSTNSARCNLPDVISLPQKPIILGIIVPCTPTIAGKDKLKAIVWILFGYKGGVKAHTFQVLFNGQALEKPPESMAAFCSALISL